MCMFVYVVFIGRILQFVDAQYSTNVYHENINESVESTVFDGSNK